MKDNRIRQETLIDKSNFSLAESELPTSLASLPVTKCETTLAQSQSSSLKSQNAIPSTNLSGTGSNSVSQNGGNINCNQLRAGDWVCLLCNNLNFSFRSECNRCLVQTKKKNFFQNMMLVQDGQSSQQQVIDNNPEISSSHQDDFKNQIVGNQSHNGESKLIETPLKYERYAASKAGCGFENVLLLLTPNRNNLHSDDDAEQHRVSAATTAPLSSHSGSDPDQPNDAKHSEKGMLVDSDKNRIQVPFEEDEIFGRDNHCKKTSAEATALQFSSSPEDQKGKRTGAVGEQANKGESLIQENQYPGQAQFQLFGQATQFPHFMSSPSSMHDDDEQEENNQKETNELRQFDNEESDCSSGSFQNEIQQQINNIIMDEEECKNTGMTHNDDKPDATFRQASNSLNPNDKPSFSFGGIFGQLPAHTTHSLNQIKESGLSFSDSHRNICQSLNFNQVGGQAFSLSNNSNNSCGGVNFSNYSQFVAQSNHFNDSHSALQQGLQGSQSGFQVTPQNFQNQSVFQASESHFFNSKGINAQSKMNNSQKNLKDQPANSEQNNGFIFDNAGSNTFIPVSNSNGNVFGKLAQYDTFYQQESLFNQNTINFEQASVFAGKSHQIEEISQEEQEEYAEGDNEDELGEQSHNSGVKSAKKSNNIRKKRKNQGSENKKKPNKFALAIHQHHSFHHNSLQQLNAHPHGNNIHASTSSQPVPDNAVKESESQSYGGMQQSGNQGISNNLAGNPKKQDWICPRCANLNYSFRKLCNKCQFAKNNFAIHIPPNYIPSSEYSPASF